MAIPRRQFFSLSGTWLSYRSDGLVQGHAGTQSHHQQRVYLQMEAGKHLADRCTPPC